MSRSTFYRLGLFVPYLLPALGLILINVLDAVPEGISTVLGVAVVSALIWFAPYTLVLIGLLVWSRGKDAARIRRAFLLAPVLLALAMALIALPFSDGGEMLLGAVALVALALGVGYAFVGLWLLLEMVLRRWGKLNS